MATVTDQTDALQLPPSLSSEHRDVLTDLVRRNEADYGDNLLGLVLSGSAGRGMATDRSDLDVFTVLADTGYVSQRELSDAARAKVESILSDVIAYTAGNFEFEDGVLPKGAVDLKLPTERLVLAARRGQMTAPARDDAAELLERRRKLFARIERVRLPREATLKSRYHGDYHLGQVLLNKLDFLIIDFEGEPARSFDQRRAKHSPLKDVAGMLRSFDYARWTALRQALEGHVDYERLAPHAEDWVARVRRAFLGAYEEAVRGSELYDDLGGVQDLLALFELEKALYELRYELNNRPGWVGIPLTGILALSD